MIFLLRNEVKNLQKEKKTRKNLWGNFEESYVVFINIEDTEKMWINRRRAILKIVIS